MQKLFVNDVIEIYNKYRCDSFEIQTYFKEFIIVFNEMYKPLENLSNLQYDENMKNTDFIRENMSNETWHDILSKEFAKNNIYFKVINYDNKTMSCILNTNIQRWLHN